MAHASAVQSRGGDALGELTFASPSGSPVFVSTTTCARRVAVPPPVAAGVRSKRWSIRTSPRSTAAARTTTSSGPSGRSGMPPPTLTTMRRAPVSWSMKAPPAALRWTSDAGTSLSTRSTASCAKRAGSVSIDGRPPWPAIAARLAARAGLSFVSSSLSLARSRPPLASGGSYWSSSSGDRGPSTYSPGSSGVRASAPSPASAPTSSPEEDGDVTVHALPVVARQRNTKEPASTRVGRRMGRSPVRVGRRR